MNTLTSELREVTAEKVAMTKDTLRVELADGRTVEAPLAWYPRLLRGTAKERSHWRLIAGGEGIHWPDLDEDISVQNVLLGHPSGESQHSFKKWLEARNSKSASRPK
jgi:uncharacterized protein DUF2442